jgi:hypothetical protein
MPNLSTLAGRLLTQELGSDDSTVLFTTDRRNGALFDGVREFADITECFIKRSTVTLTGGVSEYDLHASTIVAGQDFIRFAADQPVEIQYTDASSLTTYHVPPEKTVRWLDEHMAGWRTSTISSGMQIPQYCYRRAEGGHLYLGFTPQPSTGSSASMRVLVPFVAYPATSTSSTWVPFTADGQVRYDLQPFHQGLVHYAAHQLEKLRRDEQASDRQLQKFTVYVQRYWQALRRKGGGTVAFAKSYFRRQTQAEDPRT